MTFYFELFWYLKLLIFIFATPSNRGSWWDAWVAERNGLLNRRTGNTVPRVRIPPSPRKVWEGSQAFLKGSGRSVARLSRLLWEQEVASSNLAAPTGKQKPHQKWCGFFMLCYCVPIRIGKVASSNLAAPTWLGKVVKMQPSPFLFSPETRFRSLISWNARFSFKVRNASFSKL